ncbi:hypothetical protein HYC85_011290 [Camellia sinensis]|uniref:NFD4 C-terminal domain-containing protein n=1 Tax=Camellia sinensis TaxID=4442 RepID=A0A7J7H9V4_CAMSI|nr:hypothetical protein HYC85_011290 [Camellia sinensis]
MHLKKRKVPKLLPMILSELFSCSCFLIQPVAALFLNILSKTIPRTIWMTFTQIIMTITYLLFASALDTLYIATAVLGICYGFQFSIMGTQAFFFCGIIFNFMSLRNPLGALLFSGVLAGFVYDSEAAKQHSTSCLGPNCFRLTFIVLAGVCAMGTVLSVVLTKLYEMLYAGGSFRLIVLKIGRYATIRYVSSDMYRKNRTPRRIQVGIPLRLKIAGESTKSRYVSLHHSKHRKQ